MELIRIVGRTVVEMAVGVVVAGAALGCIYGVLLSTYWVAERLGIVA